MAANDSVQGELVKQYAQYVLDRGLVVCVRRPFSCWWAPVSFHGKHRVFEGNMSVATYQMVASLQRTQVLGRDAVACAAADRGSQRRAGPCPSTRSASRARAVLGSQRNAGAARVFRRHGQGPSGAVGCVRRPRRRRWWWWWWWWSALTGAALHCRQGHQPRGEAADVQGGLAFGGGRRCARSRWLVTAQAHANVIPFIIPIVKVLQAVA